MLNVSWMLQRVTGNIGYSSDYNLMLCFPDFYFNNSFPSFAEIIVAHDLPHFVSSMVDLPYDLIIICGRLIIKGVLQ